MIFNGLTNILKAIYLYDNDFDYWKNMSLGLKMVGSIGIFLLFLAMVVGIAYIIYLKLPNLIVSISDKDRTIKKIEKGECAIVQRETYLNEYYQVEHAHTYVYKLVSFYSNEGDKFMEMSGQKIDLTPNIVEEAQYSYNNGWGYVETVSSVMTITIDGKEIESCGSTIIFAEKGLQPEVDFTAPEFINSVTDGSITDNTLIAGIVNRVKNKFGKSRVVVIQSQLGDPICAYSGNEVYWEVCKDLPKTTKLMIDGKALYIHRANFQIIDKSLLN